jgi:hypothetical protein
MSDLMKVGSAATLASASTAVVGVMAASAPLIGAAAAIGVFAAVANLAANKETPPTDRDRAGAPAEKNELPAAR